MGAAALARIRSAQGSRRRGEDAAGVDIVAGGRGLGGHPAAAGAVLDADAGRRRRAGRRCRRGPRAAGRRSTTPPPMPVEMVRKTMSCPSPAPARCSPHAAACASLAQRTGAPRRRGERVGEREASREVEGGGVQRAPAAVADQSGDRRADRAVAAAPGRDERRGASSRRSGPVAMSVATRASSTTRPSSADQRGEHLGAADVDREDASCRRPRRRGAAQNQPVTCSGRVIAEPTTTAQAPRRSASAACSGVRMRPSAITRGVEPAHRRDQREVGLGGLRAADVAGEGRADDVGAGRVRARASSVVGAVGHGEAAMAWIACRRSATPAGRARPVASKAMMSAPAAARASTSAMKGVMRTGLVGEVALDEADDRRVGRRAHGRDVGDALDAEPRRAARERRKREADHDVRPVHRAARHRLAGYDQAVDRGCGGSSSVPPGSMPPSGATRVSNWFRNLGDTHRRRPPNAAYEVTEDAIRLPAIRQQRNRAPLARRAPAPRADDRGPVSVPEGRELADAQAGGGLAADVEHLVPLGLGERLERSASPARRPRGPASRCA